MRKNDQPISNIINQIMQGSEKIQSGIASVTIEKIFKEEMGDVISSYTEHIKLKGNTLTINVLSAPLRAELLKARLKIMETLNQRLGSEIIKKVVIR